MAVANQGSTFKITESVGKRREDVAEYQDLEKHHPSSGKESGRAYRTIDGKLEEVSKLNNDLVVKDFILESKGNANIQIPSPVAGYAKVSPGYPAVSIYEQPNGQGKLLARVLHMEKNLSISNGDYVGYGQPLGQQSGRGEGFKMQYGIHAHVEVEPEQFKRYIADISQGRITPEIWSGQNDPQAERVSILEREPVPILKSGMRGEDVRELQTFLTQNGYDVKGVDGTFGDNTKTALAAFQKDHKIDSDGIYGKDSKAALKAIEISRSASLNPDKGTSAIADPSLAKESSEQAAAVPEQKETLAEMASKGTEQGEVSLEGERDRVAVFKDSFLHTMGIYSEMMPEERDRANIEVQQAMQTGIDAGNKQKEQQAQTQGGSGPVQGGVGGEGDDGVQKAPEPAKEIGLADYLFSGLHLAAYGMQAFGNRDLSMTGLFLDRAVDVFSRVIGVNDRTQEAIEREHTDIGQARQDYPSKGSARETAEAEKTEPTAEVNAASARTANGKVPTALTIDGKAHDISSFKVGPGAAYGKNAAGTLLATYNKDADRLDIFQRSSSSKGPVTSIEDFSKQTAISYGQSQEHGLQNRNQDMTASR